MKTYTEEFIGDFLEWIAANCEIKEAGDPWTGDLWQKYIVYNGESMVGWELLNIYIETLKDETP